MKNIFSGIPIWIKRWRFVKDLLVKHKLKKSKCSYWWIEDPKSELGWLAIYYKPDAFQGRLYLFQSPSQEVFEVKRFWGNITVGEQIVWVDRKIKYFRNTRAYKDLPVFN